MKDFLPERPRLVRVAVVGAGAIGGVVAAFLARAGWDLEVVCKHQETVDRALSEGFHIFGVQGEHRIPLRGVKEIHDLSGPKEVLFLATKVNDAMEAGRALLPFLEIGTDNDHVHLLVQSVPTYSVTKIVSTIKSLTAREIFRKCPEVKKQLWGGEFWTDGYYASSVGKHGNEDTIASYVMRQGNDYRKLHEDRQLVLF